MLMQIISLLLCLELEPNEDTDMVALVTIGTVLSGPHHY